MDLTARIEAEVVALRTAAARSKDERWYDLEKSYTASADLLEEVLVWVRITHDENKYLKLVNEQNFKRYSATIHRLKLLEGGPEDAEKLKKHIEYLDGCFLAKDSAVTSLFDKVRELEKQRINQQEGENRDGAHNGAEGRKD